MAAVILVALIVGGMWLARSPLSRINFAGSLGSGGRANVQAPPGFDIGVFAEGLNGPRFIAFGPDGALYVAERGAGRVVALPDADGNGRADAIRPFAADLDRPHSLAYHAGAWFVGLPSGVVRLADADGDGAAEERATIIGDLPPGGVHSTRTVAFLPDGRMVVAVGSSCNVCIEDDPRRAAILVYDNATGANGRLLATGLRNAVGLAVQPSSGALWATDNGRDLLGDDVPPETLYIVNDGDRFGWPACHAGTISDPEFGGPGACDGVVPPVLTWQAHSAPLGLAFYDGDAFPEAYRGDLFIALHGSWNRPQPVGYEVLRVPFEGGAPSGPAEVFATGWLAEGQVSGRPVGLAVGPDGALYVSDDRGGFIYRIAYDE
ncbi:MAG: sorbosone dehydrogenase family protein [Candidatus Promineofilum sp.]|nr:sorbosone dehydrogenase family protein [Promineifilum sp.]